MRRLTPLLLLCAALAGAALPTRAQIRIERDSNGQIVITNRGSAAAEALRGSPSRSAPLPPISSRERGEIRTKLERACHTEGLDYNLVASLVRAESDFRPNVLSKKGAVGLMQLMPATAKRFGVSNPWDLDQNIKGGTAYLAYLKGLFGDNVPLMLAAYNSGENAVQQYGMKIPPYAETVRYVFQILADYGQPHLVAEAKTLLASPGDYDRYYLARRFQKPVLRVLYMYIDAQGIRHIDDAPPSGVDATPIVFKDEG